MAEPSRPTIKHLFAASGDRCAFPGCRRPLIDPRTYTVVGKVCHISAKEPGGPRYDSSLSDAQRNGFGNLLLLCGEHHDVVDADERTYTVGYLCELKEAHERAAQKAIRLDEEVVELFASLGNAFQSRQATGGAKYSWVPGEWSTWLGTEADRKRFASLARGVAAAGMVTFVSTCGYTVLRYGVVDAPPWTDAFNLAATSVGLLGVLCASAALAWRPSTYRRLFGRDHLTDEEGRVRRTTVSGVCGTCKGELRLYDVPTHQITAIDREHIELCCKDGASAAARRSAPAGAEAAPLTGWRERPAAGRDVAAAAVRRAGVDAALGGIVRGHPRALIAARLNWGVRRPRTPNRS